MTDDELASAYVTGMLDAAAREQCRMRIIEDAGFAGLVAGWENRLVPLALRDEADVPPHLLAAIEQRISDRSVELPGTFTRRAGTGDWIEVSPGLKIKMLHQVTALNRETFMAWLEPGAEYVDHDHEQDEEIYMIEGDLIIGPVVLKAGDFHVAHAGRHHPVHRTKTGCICIISQAIGPV